MSNILISFGAPLQLVAGRFAVPGRGSDAALAQLVLLHLAVLGPSAASRRTRRSAGPRNKAAAAAQNSISVACRDRSARSRSTIAAMTSSSASSERTGKHRRPCRHRDAPAAPARPQGRDVLAAPADRVLEPVDEAEIAVCITDHPVAGVEPAVPPGLDGLFRHAEIAGWRMQTARRRAAPARRPRRRGSSLSWLVHDARLKTVGDTPHGSRLLCLGRRADHEIGFGRAVAVEQSHAGAGRECCAEFGGNAGPEPTADSYARVRWPALRPRAGSAPWRRADKSRSLRCGSSPARSRRQRSAARSPFVAPESSACAKVLSALMWNSGSVVQSTSSDLTPRRRSELTPHQ